MKINITIELPEGSQITPPVVEVTTAPKKEDYLDKPPYKGIMIVKARRLQDRGKVDARIYEFRYNPKDYPEVNGLSAGVPMACGNSSIRVSPNRFYPSAKGLLPFNIHEHDNYCGPNQVCYPVIFEVFDFEWELQE